MHRVEGQEPVSKERRLSPRLLFFKIALLPLLQESCREEVKKLVLEVKQFGNELFKAGKFAPAQRKYKKALRWVHS